MWVSLSGSRLLNLLLICTGVGLHGGMLAAVLPGRVHLDVSGVSAVKSTYLAGEWFTRDVGNGVSCRDWKHDIRCSLILD